MTTRMRSGSVVGLLCLAAVALLAPGTASAAAPVLNSVEVVGGQAVIHWSLPTCVESRLVETSTTNTVDRYGHFSPQNNVYSFDIPANFVSDNQVIPDDPLNGKFLAGTYYAHVGGEDTTQPAPRLRQFSNIVQFTVDANGNGSGVGEPAFGSTPCPTGSGGGGGGGGPGGGTVNKITPFGALSYPRIQHIRRLFVIARTAEAGKLTAVGSISVPGARRVYKFKRVSMKVGANTLVNIRLRLSKKNLAAVRKALRKKGRLLSAKIRVTVTNGAGAARSQKATIRVKA